MWKVFVGFSSFFFFLYSIVEQQSDFECGCSVSNDWTLWQRDGAKRRTNGVRKSEIAKREMSGLRVKACIEIAKRVAQSAFTVRRCDACTSYDALFASVVTQRLPLNKKTEIFFCQVPRKSVWSFTPLNIHEPGRSALIGPSKVVFSHSCEILIHSFVPI